MRWVHLPNVRERVMVPIPESSKVVHDVSEDFAEDEDVVEDGKKDLEKCDKKCLRNS